MVEIVLSGSGKNALSTAVMQKALDQLRAASDQPILLRGEGDAFSAGLNIKEIATLDPPALTRFLTLFDDLVVALLRHPRPVVAAVNGHAIAGGCVLALCCDLRVCTSNEAARIGLNEVAIGLIFPTRILKLAKARLAPSHLARVILEAGVYSPAEAFRLGLVHQLEEDPLAAARALLGKLAEYPQLAFSEAKRDLNRPVVELDPAEVEAYRERVLPHWTSPELRETIGLALMKRMSSPK